MTDVTTKKATARLISLDAFRGCNHDFIDLAWIWIFCV